jgi:hypothetical protein
MSLILCALISTAELAFCTHSDAKKRLNLSLSLSFVVIKSEKLCVFRFVKHANFHSPRFARVCRNDGRIERHCIIRQSPGCLLIISMGRWYANICRILLHLSAYSWKLISLFARNSSSYCVSLTMRRKAYTLQALCLSFTSYGVVSVGNYSCNILLRFRSNTSRTQLRIMMMMI